MVITKEAIIEFLNQSYRIVEHSGSSIGIRLELTNDMYEEDYILGGVLAVVLKHFDITPSKMRDIEFNVYSVIHKWCLKIIREFRNK